MCQRGQTAHEEPLGPVAVRQDPPGPLPRLVGLLGAGRSCTPSRRASRPAAARPCRAARMARWTGTSSAMRSGDVRQRRSGRDWSVPRPEQGGSTSTRSNGSAVGEGGGVALDDLDDRRPLARRGAAQAVGAAGRSARRRRPSPRRPSARPGASSCRPARRRGRARARRAAGRARARRASRRATAGRSRPRATRRSPRRSSAACEHERLGRLAGRPRRGCRRDRTATSGLTRSAGSAGSLIVRSSARASSAPSSSHHSSASQSGTEWAIAASRTRRVAQRRGRLAQRRGAARR